MIKPYYEEENIKIYLGDCFEVMKELPDSSIDLIVTDPPYGITKNDWDKVPPKEYFDEMFRVSKNQIIFGGNFFDLPKKLGWVVWYKRPFLKTTNEAELIWTSFKIKNKVLDYTYAGNYEGFTGSKIKPNYKKKKIVYTSEKPVAVLKWLLENFSSKDDIILDPFMGSGTTLRACKDLGRRGIGIEINKEYCDIAIKRLAQEVLNLNM